MRVSQAYLSTEQSSVANYKFTLIAITRETIKLYLTQHCAADFVPNFYRGLYIPPRSPFININKLLNHQGGGLIQPPGIGPPRRCGGGGFYFIISRFLDTVNPLLYIFFTSRLTRTMEILYLTFYFFFFFTIVLAIYIDIYI